MRDHPEAIASWLMRVQRRLYREACRGEAVDLRVLVCHANFLDQIRRELYPTTITEFERSEALIWATTQIGMRTADLFERLVEIDARQSRLRHVEMAYDDEFQ